MGLNDEQMSYYPTLTREEMARMHPCKKAKCRVMMSADSSPTMQSTLNYVELPDEPRPGKITPSSPLSNNSTTNNSSPSPRGSKSNGGTSASMVDVDEEEAIEEALPIAVSTLPSPEPRPLITRNGYKKDHHQDRIDGAPVKNNFKPLPTNRDVDEDSCLIKCVYFTQQCCECVVL